jgi:phosphate starvation-inducible membrane PsiE
VTADAPPASTGALRARIQRVGDRLVEAFTTVALFVIGGTIVWSAIHDYVAMIHAGRGRLDDILLLFIYLELGAMIGIYFKTERLPVLFLLYVAITALTRYMAIDSKELPSEGVLTIAVSILLLAVAVLLLRIAEYRYAAPLGGEDHG